MMFKKSVSALLSLIILTQLFVLNLVSAALGRAFNQWDTKWKNYTYNTGTLYDTGCGIFAFGNAIYGLNGKIIDAPAVAQYAYNEGTYNIYGSDGSYRFVMYSAIAKQFGNTYGFKISGSESGITADINSQTLINHLKGGGVAVLHVYQHYLAVTEYDAIKGFHIIESAVHSSRGLEADSWVTPAKLSDGNTNVDWFILLSNAAVNSGNNKTADNTQQADIPDLAGIYTTKNVTTTLNMRSGKGTGFPIVTAIPNGALINVTKSDGEWADVEYNGFSGYASMDYLQKISQIEISGYTAPTGFLTAGKAFSLKGIITSNIPLIKVWGGVYDRNGNPTKQFKEVAVNSKSYNLSPEFDNAIVFNALSEGKYTYRIAATDGDNNTRILVESDFTIGNPPIQTETTVTSTVQTVTQTTAQTETTAANTLQTVTQTTTQTETTAVPMQVTVYGDVDGDGKLTVNDVIAVRLYILSPNKYPLSEQGLVNAVVVNPGSSIKPSDAVAMQDALVEILSLPIYVD